MYFKIDRCLVSSSLTVDIRRCHQCAMAILIMVLQAGKGTESYTPILCYSFLFFSFLFFASIFTPAMVQTKTKTKTKKQKGKKKSG